ncbi:ROK family protein [Kocuria flava]|uniref:polyphosphate--glucose phosphotransferase n=1 Tax=Kocuria flava TaxID=446860 RepID=UPI001FF288F8|nr:ROK family protein [Kocuria flava]MCJ8503799.1 ROK family protein [Kocuria flava]
MARYGRRRDSISGWSTLHRLHIGVDVGGAEVAAAVVDPVPGSLLTPVRRVPAPVPATPEAVAAVVAEAVAELAAGPHAPDEEASVGVALPAIVRQGTTRSAAHIDPGWVGLAAERFLAERVGRPVHVINDADAAGIAEAHHGAGRDPDGRPVAGTVLLVTLGTGIGSAMIVDGRLVPNLELGHLEVGGVPAEQLASAEAKEREGLDWPAYAQRLQRYLAHLEFVASPDLIVVGGTLSEQHERFLPLLRLSTPVVPAALRAAAGVVGAARTAYLSVPPLD